MSVFINGWTKEKVINHIKANFKGRSYDRLTDECKYLCDDGKKCAVGMFIPSDIYDPYFEGVAVTHLFNKLSSVLPLKFDNMFNLQRAHDRDASDEACLNDMLEYVESLT